jgi:hypothetical protein
MLRNSIHSNGEIGINLSGGTELASGVTLNDLQDPDTGVNLLQNYPVITTPIVNTGAGTTPINLTLNSLPNSTFRIEIFSNTSTDTSGFGEGQRFVLADTVLTDGSGNTVLIDNLPVSLAPVGSWITATATRIASGAFKETSEFSEAVQLEGPTVSFSGKVYLEGSYSGGGMTTPPAFHNVLPTSQPYASAFFNGTEVEYDGSEVVTSIGSDIIDWVVVSLRDPPSPSVAVMERAAFVRDDGELANLDGTSPLTIFGADSAWYYVVVCHRNHMCVMSELVDMNSGSGAFDFTANPGFTTGPRPQKTLEDFPSVVYGLFACDINADGMSTALDFNAWLPSTKSVQTGYLSTDCNMDGQVTAADFNLWLPNTKAVASSQAP